MYLTGYLTRVREEELTDAVPEGMTVLVIPNAEIKEIFETTVIQWFDDSTKQWSRRELFDAVWNEDSEKVAEEMNKLCANDQLSRLQGGLLSCFSGGNLCGGWICCGVKQGTWRGKK